MGERDEMRDEGDLFDAGCSGQPAAEIRLDGIFPKLDGRPETKKVTLRGGIQLVTRGW